MGENNPTQGVCFYGLIDITVVLSSEFEIRLLIALRTT